MTEADFSMLVYQALGVVLLALATLVTAVVPLLVLYWKRKLGLEIDAAQRTQLVGAINNGLAYGAQVVKENRITPDDATDVQVQQAKIYVGQAAPVALAYFKLDVRPDVLDKKIKSQLAPSTVAGATAMIVPTGKGQPGKPAP